MVVLAVSGKGLSISQPVVNSVYLRTGPIKSEWEFVVRIIELRDVCTLGYQQTNRHHQCLMFRISMFAKLLLKKICMNLANSS